MLKLQKQSLETQLCEVQRSKEAEVQELQNKLSALDTEMHHLKESQANSLEMEELNQRLSLALEKEKGKVEGMYLVMLYVCFEGMFSIHLIFT